VVLPRSTSSWRRLESSELVIRSLTLNMSSHRAEGDLNPVINFAKKKTIECKPSTSVVWIRNFFIALSDPN
jgi:hypothetical protein